MPRPDAEIARVALRHYVDGRTLAPGDFVFDMMPTPHTSSGSVLVRTLALSVDPVLRGSMSGSDRFYLPQFELGAPIHSRGVGRVVSSEHPDFKAGDLVKGRFAWSPLCVAAPQVGFAAGTGLTHASPADAKLTHHLGVLGGSGDTAFFGMVFVAGIRPGDSVLVSGAAGAVGSLAGQIARILGAGRVVGLAGTDHKCTVLTSELGFDAAVNYNATDLEERLHHALPGGPQIYFDNVGGAISQTVMNLMPRGGKVVECGQIATYDDPGGGWLVDIRPIHARGLRFEAFERTHYLEFLPAAVAQLAHWVQDGSIKVLETVRHGLQALPEAFLGMLSGENVGKMVVVLGDD